MTNVLMLLPESDYDPTESAVPWERLRQAGHTVSFATPNGLVAPADTRLTDWGFGLLSPILMTRRPDLQLYRRMADDPAYTSPLTYEQAAATEFDALVIPGGHAQGMKTMLESEVAQTIVADFFEKNRPVAAVCHGVLLLARSRSAASGRSVLHGRRTTALTRTLELSAWMLTAAWLGRYYRTYPETVQDEVSAALASPKDFLSGPLGPHRDTADDPSGFVVRDGNYLSARWPGDCHRFANELVAMIEDDSAKRAL